MEQPGKRLLGAARKRAKWMKTDEGFGIVGIKDTVSGRREYLGRIEKTRSRAG